MSQADWIIFGIVAAYLGIAVFAWTGISLNSVKFRLENFVENDRKDQEISPRTKELPRSRVVEVRQEGRKAETKVGVGQPD